MKICPQCSGENRDTANYCIVCRASLAGVQPVNTRVAQPPAQHGGTYHVPQTFQPGQPYAPQQNSSPKMPMQTSGQTGYGGPIQAIGQGVGPWQPQQHAVPRFSFFSNLLKRNKRIIQPGQRGWSFWHGQVIAEGYVSAADPVRDMPMPFDPGQTLFVLSMALIGLGVLLAVATAALAVAIVLLILGIGGLCIAPILLPMVGAVLYPLYRALRGKRDAPMIEFRVEDEWAGQPLSVVLFLSHGSPSVRLGDRVRVYGSRRLFSRILQAHYLEITESNHQPTSYGVDGIRPWPIWVGLLSLALVIAGYWWLISNGTFAFY